MPKLIKMSQSELIIWVRSLNFKFGQAIIDGINKESEESGIAVTGKSFWKADDADDLHDILGINSNRAEALYQKIQDKKETDFDVPEEQAESETTVLTFDLKILAKKTHTIQGADSSWTIMDVKRKFLKMVGDNSKAILYEQHSYKWNKAQREGIEIKSGGKSQADNKTLKDLGIINGLHAPLITTWRVNGGAEAKYDPNELGIDKYRVRKIRTKKYKGMIKLSKKPDCIMGYTNADGIKRAEMPCGCSFAADTMFRYTKSLFEKNLKAVKPVCPVPKPQCKGNNKQREWEWGLVYAVSDLTDKEIELFSKAVENRLGGTKSCPHCGIVTEKPEKVEITRVRCTACSNSDWCWHCGKVWNHSGLGPICGNKGCMADQINELLKIKNCGSTKAPQEWVVHNKGGTIPTTRACRKCFSMMEYVKACKHISCIACPHQFCFNCNKDWGSPDATHCNRSQNCYYGGIQFFN